VLNGNLLSPPVWQPLSHTETVPSSANTYAIDIDAAELATILHFTAYFRYRSNGHFLNRRSRRY
jgi:hypothetical protein